MIMGSSLLKKFSQKRHVPPYALLVAVIVPAVIVAGSYFSTDAITKIISFAALGIYIAFQMVVVAALRARLKGWVPSGKYSLGAWGLPVNVVALAYGIIAMVNMAWPRTPDAPWYDNWIVALSAIVVIGIGLIYMAVHPLHDRSTAPYDDAIPREPARS
jgi:amino acid transporter